MQAMSLRCCRLVLFCGLGLLVCLNGAAAFNTPGLFGGVQPVHKPACRSGGRPLGLVMQRKPERKRAEVARGMVSVGGPGDDRVIREPSLGSLTLRRFPKLLPRVIDASLAGAGLGGSISLLCILQNMLGLKLFAAPMMASGIIFFAAQKPPSPTGFLVGTLAGVTICEALFLTMPDELSHGVAAGVLLMVYKLTNSMFPPAAVLSVLLSQAVENAEAAGILGTPAEIIKFAAFPWLVGHFAMYQSAVGVSKVREEARNWTMKSQIRSLTGDLSRDVLFVTFHNFDIDGSGYLDADELRQALRTARGEDVPLEDCMALIGAVDADGDGVVDFEEFCAICEGSV